MEIILAIFAIILGIAFWLERSQRHHNEMRRLGYERDEKGEWQPRRGRRK